MLLVWIAPAMLIAPSCASIRMSPAPADTVLAPPCVTPTPVRLTPTPVTFWLPSASAPPAVVSEVAPVPPFTVPVTVRPPPASFSVNAPLVANAPRLVTVLALPRLTVLPVLPVSVPVLMIPPGCVTGPVMSPAIPSVVVPATSVVRLLNATELALRIVSAVALLLAVVTSPLRAIAPPPPSISTSPPAPKIVVPPALVTAAACRDTPTPLMLELLSASVPPGEVMVTAPLPLVVMAPLTPNPPVWSLSVNAPLLVNEVTLPRISFAFPSETVLFVLPMSAPTLSVVPVFCVTAPVMSCPTPSTSLPPPGAILMSPSATVEALWIDTALSDAKVVVSRPARSIAAPPPSTMIEPAPASTVLPADCVTPKPVRPTENAPLDVMLCAPRSSAPPAVLMFTKLLVVPVVTEPVRVSPPVESIKLNEPPRVTVPRFAIWLPALRSVTAPPELTVSVFALTIVAPFCVTAPERLSTPAPPSTTVPLTADRLLSVAAAESMIWIAVPPAFVVVSVESLSWIAPSLPSTRIVPLPGLTAMPVFTVTPPPVRLTLPEVEEMLWPTVNPVDPSSETVPVVVVRVPLVASAPPLLWKSILPVPVLNANAGKVSVEPAIAVMPVFAPSVGAARVRALASLTETAVPVELSVTAPEKSFVAFESVMLFAPALKLETPLVIEVATVCVIAPPAVTERLAAAPPPILPSSIALASTSVVLPAVICTEPWKSLPAESSTTISVGRASTRKVPATTMLPESVRDGPMLIRRFPPTVEVPTSNAKVGCCTWTLPAAVSV